MKLKLSAALGLCLLACVAPARAQQAKPAPTARQLELAQQLLRETGADANYETMLRNMFTPLFRSPPPMANSPEAAARMRQVSTAITEAVIEMKPQILDLSARAYAETFTEEEMTQLLELYRSPAGQMMIRKTPLLTQRIGEATAREMPSMMRAMAVKLCATSDCPPGLKQLSAPPAAKP